MDLFDSWTICDKEVSKNIPKIFPCPKNKANTARMNIISILNFFAIPGRSKNPTRSLFPVSLSTILPYETRGKKNTSEETLNSSTDPFISMPNWDRHCHPRSVTILIPLFPNPIRIVAYVQSVIANWICDSTPFPPNVENQCSLSKRTWCAIIDAFSYLCDPVPLSFPISCMH